MKTAVSLPDEIFQRASKEAKRLGISRSELVARALREYLRDRSNREVRASYDRAFGEEALPDDATELRREAAKRALQDVEW